MDPLKKKRGRPKSAHRENDAETLQSLERALGVLKAIARTGRATLSELSIMLGVPTATTRRILVTLEKSNFARFDEVRQDWTIGIEAYRTGSAFLKQSSLTEVARPVMRALVEKTGETANLAIPDHTEVVFIGQIETQNPIRAFFPPGVRTAMHATGTGKAFLSAMTTEDAREKLQTTGLEQFTDRTLVRPEDLFDDLARARARGWSLERQERYEGMSCVASVIFDQYQEPIAALSVSGPSTRFEEPRTTEIGAAVAIAAAKVTKLTGGRAPADWPSA